MISAQQKKSRSPTSLDPGVGLLRRLICHSSSVGRRPPVSETVLFFFKQLLSAGSDSALLCDARRYHVGTSRSRVIGAVACSPPCHPGPEVYGARGTRSQVPAEPASCQARARAVYRPLDHLQAAGEGLAMGCCVRYCDGRRRAVVSRRTWATIVSHHVGGDLIRAGASCHWRCSRASAHRGCVC